MQNVGFDTAALLAVDVIGAGAAVTTVVAAVCTQDHVAAHLAP